MELWQILLGMAFLLAILTFTYPLVMRMMRKRREGREEEEERIEEKEKRREEEVIKIIREIRELKKRIEKEEGELTSLSDVFLVSVQNLFEIRGVNNEIRGINERIKETKAIIWFGVGTLLAFGLAIISMV
jgi:flagellar biosynthesis/type III secretory pathway M-ring protein FliF/YscJ